MSPPNRKSKKKQKQKMNKKYVNDVKNSKNRKNEEDKIDRSFKEKVTEILELPKEVVLDIPKITMIGNGSLIVENYKGIIEYGDSKIRINTGKGIIKIQGDVLFIREITSENVVIIGKISSLEFME